MPSLKITRTVTVIHTVPFGPDYYPDMTIEEAAAYERNLSEADVAEMLTEDLSCGENNVYTVEVEILANES